VAVEGGDIVEAAPAVGAFCGAGGIAEVACNDFVVAPAAVDRVGAFVAL